MSKDEEDKIVDSLTLDVGAVQKITKLLELRRSRYKGNLEDADDPETRGRSKECRDLLKMFNE